MSHDVYAGEYVCWDFLVTKCSDLPTATALLAEHGRTAHRLHEQVTEPLIKKFNN